MRQRCRHRPVQYLNNILEQGHRGIKKRITADLMKEVLPVGETTNHATIREHCRPWPNASNRSWEKNANLVILHRWRRSPKLPLPDGAMTVGIDGRCGVRQGDDPRTHVAENISKNQPLNEMRAFILSANLCTAILDPRVAAALFSDQVWLQVWQHQPIK